MSNSQATITLDNGQTLYGIYNNTTSRFRPRFFVDEAGAHRWQDTSYPMKSKPDSKDTIINRSILVTAKTLTREFEVLFDPIYKEIIYNFDDSDIFKNSEAYLMGVCIDETAEINDTLERFKARAREQHGF